MSRVSVFSSPFLLGFDQLERLFDQAAKGGDGYPPYNIERFEAQGSSPERWRITLAVAGFSGSDLDVTVEDRQLIIRGRQQEEAKRDYMHRGIAGRSFAKSFVLADGMEVDSAQLEHGLLAITLFRRAPDKRILRIEVKE